jgi:hypothetical protein
MVRPKAQTKNASVVRKDKGRAQPDWHKQWESRVVHVFLIFGLALTLGRVLVDDVQRLYTAVVGIFVPPPHEKGADTPTPDRRSASSPTLREGTGPSLLRESWVPTARKAGTGVEPLLFRSGWRLATDYARADHATTLGQCGSSRPDRGRPRRSHLVTVRYLLGFAVLAGSGLFEGYSTLAARALAGCGL